MAPFDTAEEWDNPGLQVGDLSQDIRKILIALDPTLQALGKALEYNAQLLLTHHPLFFRPLSRVCPDNNSGKVIFNSVQKGVSIVALHTNLDMVNGGINDMLASLFILKKVEVLQKKDFSGNENLGLGRIGELPDAETLSSMVRIVKKVLGAKMVKVIGPPDKRIKKVAVVGGAGSGMISLASGKGADLLITGDIGHHGALEAEFLEMAVIDGGHFYTEKTALGLIYEQLKSLFKVKGMDIEVFFYHKEKDPIRYE